MYDSLEVMFAMLEGEEKLYPTAMEKAIIGTVERFGMEPQILLDQDVFINILMEEEGLTEEEAIEYFEYNVIGAWMGDNTPCFANLIKKK